MILSLFFVSFMIFGTHGKQEWWRSMSLYQIYPRSFKDSDGDGVGDLKGIQSKLQHLVDSKFDAFWLSPIYQSPMVDFGYDITDFKAVDPIFGTMEDFENLLKEAHKLGLKLIMDFVVNHSSDQHEWFQKSVKKIDPYTDYYIWHPGKIVNGTRHLPNNWLSVFNGVAWTWNEERGAYYFHDFSPNQPDVNYRNPHVVEEFKNILRYWTEKGVDGFRVDAVADLFEVEDFRDEPPSGLSSDPLDWWSLRHDYTSNRPETYDMVSQWREILDEYDSRLMAVEVYAEIDQMIGYYKAGADFPLNYDFIDNVSNSSSPQDFKKIIDGWMDNLPEGAVSDWGAGNHDRSRIFTRFGRDFGQAVTIMTQLLPGIAVTYYGEEIGMEDSYVSWNDTVDPWGRNGGPDNYWSLTRDKVRKPFQWDNSTSAGFSTNPVTWLPADESYRSLNLEAEKAARNSYYKSFLKITSLRDWPAVRSGSLRTVVLKNNTVLAFSRQLKNQKSVYVVINFANHIQFVDLKKGFANTPDQVKLYHSTADSETRSMFSQIYPSGSFIEKSTRLPVPVRGAAVYVTK